MKKKDCLKQISSIYPNDLWDTLHNRKNLIIKIGCDPTSPDLHIGHLVSIQLLKYLQDLGHKICFIIGDFTATIGDPTERNQSRPLVDINTVKVNASTYFEQIFKILDKDKTEIRYNSEWLESITKSTSGLINIMGKFTVAQILERNDFKKRIKQGNPIFLHETIYPILTGIDSVMINSDVEIGGTDQLFNMFFARSVQKAYNKPMQGVISCNLILGIDGKEKMSKSIGNTINFTTAAIDIFIKIMSISDEIMHTYYKNIFNYIPLGIGLQAKQDKLMLAYKLVELLYDQDTANNTLLEYKDTNNIKEYELQVSAPITIIDAIQKILLITRSDCKRLIDQKSVYVNNAIINDYTYKLDLSKYEIKLGKKFHKIVNITYAKLQ